MAGMPATTVQRPSPAIVRIDWSESGPVTIEQAQQIGQRICQRIISSTQAGRDAHYFPFESYSAAYARRKGVPANEVDLTATGEMLKELRVIEATPTSVTIGIDGARAVVAAAHNKGTETMPQRHFLDVNGSDEEDIQMQVLRFQAVNYLRKKENE